MAFARAGGASTVASKGTSANLSSGVRAPKQANQALIGHLEPREAMREGGVEENRDRERAALRRSRGFAAARPGRGSGRRRGRKDLHQEEAVLLRRDVRGALPGGEGQSIGHAAVGVSKRGELERRLVAQLEAHDEVSIELHVRAFEGDAVGGGLERQSIRGGLVDETVQAHADAQGARHQGLAVHGGEDHPELALQPDHADLLLKLEFEALGGPGGNRSHLHREGCCLPRATTWPGPSRARDPLPRPAAGDPDRCAGW